jgi:outer membrane protein assembly factor BamD (BamD/ComL family)
LAPMKKILLCMFCILIPAIVHAEYFYKNGTLIDVKDVAEFSLQEHFDRGMKALQAQNFPEAVHQFHVCVFNFPDADLAKEAYYFLGVSYYHIGDMDLANKNLSLYIEQQGNPKHFIEAFRHKLEIAKAFRQGARKHLFGYEKMPKVFADKEAALKIYDEIIMSVASSDIAQEALFEKAQCFRDGGEYKSSIETLKTLIKKFPKSAMSSKSYVEVSAILLEEAKVESQNPDLLEAATLNAKKLTNEFPQAEELTKRIEANLNEMKEVFAAGLYETGQLYERKSLPKAAFLYYSEAIRKFPDTQVSKLCQTRIKALDTYGKELACP